MRIILFLSLSLLAFNASALTSGFIPVEVLSVNGSAAGSYTVGTSFKATAVNGSKIFAYRNVAVSSTSVASQVAKLARLPFTPLGVAVLAAGYFYDNVNGWSLGGTGTYADPEFVLTRYWRSISNLSPTITGYSNTVKYGATPFVVQQKMADYLALSSFRDGASPRGISDIDSFKKSLSLNSWLDTDPDLFFINSFTIHRYSCGNIVASYCPQVAPQIPIPSTTVVDSELLNIYDGLSPSQKRQVFTDPDTQRISTSIPELLVAGNDLTTDYEAENDTDPGTSATVDPLTGDTGTSSVGDDPVSNDDLSNCELHPDSFGCWSGGDDLNPTDLDTLDIGTQYAQHSLNSDSTCPANLAHTTKTGLVVAYDLQPACDATSDLKPTFIIVCIMIGIAVLRGGGADV